MSAPLKLIGPIQCPNQRAVLTHSPKNPKLKFEIQVKGNAKKAIDWQNYPAIFYKSRFLIIEEKPAPKLDRCGLTPKSRNSISITYKNLGQERTPMFSGNGTFKSFIVVRASRLLSKDLLSQARRLGYIQKVQNETNVHIIISYQRDRAPQGTQRQMKPEGNRVGNWTGRNVRPQGPIGSKEEAKVDSESGSLPGGKPVGVRTTREFWRKGR